MKFHVVVLLCGFASIFIPWINGFNVETKHHAVYTEEQYSMFGFSVAEHQDRNLRGWVIVGAPEAQTIQPGVYRGGAVYRCDIYEDNSCTPIYFDVKGNTINYNPSPPVDFDNKTKQWFGATVSTSQTPDGPILACAPRYMWYSANFVRREPVGTCYITEHSFSEPKEFSPCRTRHWGYHRQGSCQAGLGAALSKDGQRVLIGAPGSYYWQGQVYSVDSTAEFPILPPRYEFFGESSGQAFSASTGNLPRVLATKEGQAKDDDSYLGYSVTTGDFQGNGEIGTAVGMPRGDALYGKVLIFNSNLSLYQHNLTGTQMGAYFGYSIISCDVDGDNLDDIIVGAPMYTIENPGESFETGRVHIFYQGTGPEKFIENETRIGFKSRGRFGLSLASLNDINHDGFGDFAVGAPYDGPEGRGAVYIYHGSKTGVLDTYSQVIYAEQVRPTISTFGFSVSGGLDLDGNEYPDMVVGAYESNTAAFFRSRPVIKMEAWVEFDSKSKYIILDEKDCVLNNRIAVPCLQLNTCLTYTGRGVQSSYLFNVEYALDTKKSTNKRLFFVDHETKSSINQTVKLLRDQDLCKSFKVYVDHNITDKLTSIDAEMRMSLVEDRGAATEPRNPTAQLTPVLGATTSRPDTLSIFKSCGSDNVCIPNLVLNVTSSITKYLLASGDKLEIDVIVNNTGEHAYEAIYYLEKPAGIEFINIERMNKTGIPVLCSAPSEFNNYTLMCDIGNPLPKNESVHFKVILQPIKSKGLKANYDLDMGVNSTNPELEETRGDNKVHFRMPIWIQTELVIEGTSKPNELYFDAGNYTSDNITSEIEFGPLLTHNYTIRNDGPSSLLEAELSLIWPAQTLAGEELLYLIEQPETVGLITCETANANYLSLKLDANRRYQQNYRGMTQGVFSTSNVDRTNQIAEEARRKHINEQPGFANGTRDYGYEMEGEILLTSNTSKHTSSGYFKNFTQNAGYTSQQGTYYESQQREQQRNQNQQNDIIRQRLQQQKEEEERQRQETIRLRLQQQREDENERLRLESQQRETIRIQLQQQKEEDERRLRLGGQESETQSLRIQQQRLEEERRRIEAENRRIDSLRIAEEERQRLIENQRKEEERFRTEAIARQRLIESQQREAEARRVEEERRLAAQRQNENTRTEIPSTYGVEKHYMTDTENSQGHRTGFGQTSGEVVTHQQTTGNSGLNFQLSNIGSSKDLEKFFSTLNQESAAITTYTRDGKEYVQFEGRFRVSQGKDCIEFRNGECFEIQDRYGEPSYSSGRSQSERFLSIEGQLIGGEDGKIYIELKDGRRFRIPGTYSYQKTRTFTVSGGPQDRQTGTGSYTYEKQITHEGVTSDGRIFEPFGTNYREESYEEKYKSGKKIISGVNSANFDTIRGTFDADNIPTIRPDDRLNRYPRESDVLNVEQFRKFEKSQRHERDLGGFDFDAIDEESEINRYRRDDTVNYGADVVGQGEVSSCKSAHCVRLQCTFGPLAKDQEVMIKMRYRVKAKTLKKIASNEKVKISTQLIARVTKQEFIVDTPDEQLTKSHEITTIIHPSAAPTGPDVVPLWVVVLSACAGTIILLLLIFLLYKLGFFKRNRPNNAPERQPLNRNGHYSNED